MKAYEDYRVINGTWGELWIDGVYMAEVLSLQAKVSLEKSDVKQTRRLGTGKKVTGISGTGTIKMNKVTSYFIEKLSDNLKNGKTTTATIKSKLADPDAFGTEEVELYGCTFDELTLADWEAGKNGEESVPFTFSDWKITSTINA